MKNGIMIFWIFRDFVISGLGQNLMIFYNFAAPRILQRRGCARAKVSLTSFGFRLDLLSKLCVNVAIRGVSGEEVTKKCQSL